MGAAAHYLDMENKKRHPAGTPASQGGQFAPENKPEADTALAAAEQPFRDLGFEGALRPYDGYDAEIPAGSQVFTSENGRQVVLGIVDDEFFVFSQTDEYDTWTTNSSTSDSASELVVSAVSDVAISEQLHNLVSSPDDVDEHAWEIRDASAAVSPNGDLITEIAFSDDDGNWSTIDYNHSNGKIQVSRDGTNLDEAESDEILVGTSVEYLGGMPWDAAFLAHARGMASDPDVAAEVRALASVEPKGWRHFTTAAALAGAAQDTRGPVIIEREGESFAAASAYIDGDGDIIVEGRATSDENALRATELVALIEQASELGLAKSAIRLYGDEPSFNRIGVSDVGDEKLILNVP